MIRHPRHRTPHPTPNSTPDLRLVQPEPPTHLGPPRVPLTIPPVLAGETTQLLVMTGHGTYLVDATITAVKPRSDRRSDGWRITADLSPTRSCFALVSTADRLSPDHQARNDCAIATAHGPMPTRCPGCRADRGETCRWKRKLDGGQ